MSEQTTRAQNSALSAAHNHISSPATLSHVLYPVHRQADYVTVSPYPQYLLLAFGGSQLEIQFVLVCRGHLCEAVTIISIVQTS